jgi:large subunit ribosomal protein L30
MTYGVIRVRGSADLNTDIKDTLSMLGLEGSNHATVVAERDSFEGMLEKSKDYTAYGEIRAGTLAKLLGERGELESGDAVDDEFVDENTDYDDVQAFAEAVAAGETRIRDVPGLSPTFRLHPPKGGFKSTKEHATVGGTLGYRGEEINDLIDSML